LDFDEEDRLLEFRGGCEDGSVEDSSGGGDDLTTTSVDSISMEGNILDVEAATSHVLFSEDTFFGGPLEGSFHGVLDFVEILNGLGGINEKVSSGSLGSEAPNLLGIIGVPFVFISEDYSTCFGILLARDLVSFDSVGEFITERAGGDVEAVILVGGLGEANLGALGGDSRFV